MFSLQQMSSSEVAETYSLVQGEVNDDDFRNYFEQFGEIEDCVVSHCLLDLDCGSQTISQAGIMLWLLKRSLHNQDDALA